MIENRAFIKTVFQGQKINSQNSSSSVIGLTDIETCCASSFLINIFDVFDNIVNALFFQ